MNKRIRISRIGSTVREQGDTVFLVDYDDGTSGTLAFPTELGGNFIEGIHRAFLGGAGPQEIPEIDALRLGLARDDKGHLVMKIDTAQAHAIVCILRPDQWTHLRDVLGDFDNLPLVQSEKPN